jgi:hypothetical protein
VTADTATAAQPSIVAPYITSWTGEEEPVRPVISRGLGIGFEDEILTDRDKRGVLWIRMAQHRGEGRPVFGKVHPLRQRRAMTRLLCQVCAGPADRTEDGVLFLLKDHRQDWPGWPNRMGVAEPPVCWSCVRLSTRVCPALRQGAVLVRAGWCEVAGVNGVLYSSDPTPRPVGQVSVAFDNPAIRWIKAAYLIRELLDCTLIELDRADQAGEVGSCRS